MVMKQNTWTYLSRKRENFFLFLLRRKQKRRSAVQLLISTFVFATRIVQFFFYLKYKVQASSLYDCIDCFVSDLVGNPYDRFPCVAAHFMLRFKAGDSHEIHGQNITKELGS